MESISAGAFAGCKRLSSVKIGAKVNHIFYQAFKDCISLSAIDLGNVEILDYQMFYGCSNLKSITIPKTVKEASQNSSYGCLEGSSIETVVFEEGISIIPAYICKNASSVTSVVLPEKADTVDGYEIGQSAFLGTSISSVTLPNSLTKIRPYAFEGCALLTEIVIPDNVESISAGAFAGCKRLRNVKLGEKVNHIYYEAFANCTSLSKIDLRNVEILDYRLFSGCSNLTELTIPKTVKEASQNSSYGCLQGSAVETLYIQNGAAAVPAYLAKNCESLKTVYIPETCETIYNYAFANCTNLSSIVSDRSTFLFYSNSFSNCPKLEDSRLTVFDLNHTSLTANSDQASVNGIVNYTLKYKLMPSLAGNVSNMSINLSIPESLTLLVDSVQSKNIEIDAEKIQNGRIPVSADEGELRFSARITQVGNYTVSASAKFYYNNSDWVQSIGSLEVECPKLTLAVPETVNELTANVYGIAQKGETVSVYVNNSLAGTLTANSYTGKYQGAVVLPAGKNGDTYEIYAKVGDEVSETAKTVYAFEKPVVKQVIFGYNQHATLDITDVLIRGVSPVVSFNPSYPTSYEITATNNEKIDRMFVTSTKGDKEKYIEAFYNAETGTWIAKGYFDPSNHSYVPGTLNISIIEKTMTVLDSSYDYNQDQTFAKVPEGFKENSTVEIVSETKDSVLANINVSDGTASESFRVYSNQSSDGAYINGSFVSAEQIAKDPAKYGYTLINTQTVDNGQKSTYYIRTANNEDASATMLLELGDAVGTLGDIWSGASLLELIEGDAADNPVVKFTNEFITESASQGLELMFGSGYSNIATGLSFGSDVLTFAGQVQLANGDTEYTVLASVLFAAKCFNTFGGTDLVLASMGIVPPFSTLIKAGINMLLDYADDALIDWIKSGKHFFGSGHIRFIIDPSGIICEAVAGNTVEGATVTIYYQDKEGNPVKWNAEDYDQKNPLLTDEFGQYLWDVPEGKWKVVCEMEGYDTVESEWLDIPPIRTDVNLFITSKATPELVAAELTNDGLKVQFSKFMDISTVTASVLTLEGFDGTFTVSPKLLNEGDIYADTFILNGSFTDTLKSVSVTAGAVSYAGTAAAAGTVAVSDLRFALGDANRDGAVNLKDAVVIRRYIAEGWDTEIDLNLADVNGDSTVNLKDAVMLRRYIAGGWDVTFKAAA